MYISLGHKFYECLRNHSIWAIYTYSYTYICASIYNIIHQTIVTIHGIVLTIQISKIELFYKFNRPWDHLGKVGVRASQAKLGKARREGKPRLSSRSYAARDDAEHN